MLRQRAQRPLIGRERELAALCGSLDAARQGASGAVLIGGEPGIGKTRLLTELAERAQSAGWLILSGRAYEAEGMPPYLPFVEALREYVLSYPAEALRGVLGRAAPEIARLVPELREVLPDLPESASPSPEHDRYRLFEGVVQALFGIARAATGPGLVLVLDDLHLADTPTLLLLHHLARQSPGNPVLIAGAHRNAAADVRRPLADLLAELSREGLAEHIALAPLSPADAAILIEEMSGTRPAPVVAEALHRASEGNPFLLGELVRHLCAEGRNLADEQTAAAGWGISEGVRRVLDARLAHLRPETYRALQTAAVLGVRLDLAVLVAMGEFEEDELARSLEEACGLGMLHEERGDQGYAFAHALLQEKLYADLNLLHRQRLHQRAGEAIERLYARNLMPYLVSLAAHYRLAGASADPQKAIEYALRAAQAAQAVFAFEDAERHWQAALELMERHGGAPERRADLLERLGDLLQETGFGNYARSVDCFEQAIRIYEQLGDAERAARVHSRLGLVLGAGSPAMDLERAAHSFRTALAAVPDGAENVTAMNAYAGLGLLAVWRLCPDEGLADARRAMAIAERLGEPRWINAAVMAGANLITLGRLREGLDLMARAWEEAARLNQTFRGHVAATWLGGRYTALLAPVEAQAWYRRELAQTRQTLVPMRRRALEDALASAIALEGDLAAAHRTILDQGRPAEDVLRQPLVALFSGAWEQAAAQWRKDREFCIRRGIRSTQAFTNVHLGAVLHLLGDTREVQLLLEESLLIGREGPDLVVQVSAGAELARLYAERGDPERAIPLLARCRHILAAGEEWHGLAARVACADAAVAVAEGRADDAESHFTTAIKGFRRCSLPWYEAEALIAWADAAARTAPRPLPARVEALFAAASAVYRRIGAGRQWLERLEAKRNRVQDEPVASVEAYPDGLTTREVEVLRLLAAGQSNREIGAALVLSVRTVERHIENIYLKTGAHSRTKATLYAQEHHLR